MMAAARSAAARKRIEPVLARLQELDPPASFSRLPECLALQFARTATGSTRDADVADICPCSRRARRGADAALPVDATIWPT